MSKITRRQMESAEAARTMYSKLEQEMAEGFIEVEGTGLTFRRLVAVYAIMMRGAWAHTLDGLRSLLRPTPAL